MIPLAANKDQQPDYRGFRNYLLEMRRSQKERDKSWHSRSSYMISRMRRSARCCRIKGSVESGHFWNMVKTNVKPVSTYS